MEEATLFLSSEARENDADPMSNFLIFIALFIGNIKFFQI